MNTLKLSRCPFCNSHELTMEASPVVYWVRCFECGACGPNGHTHQSAADLWNGQHIHTNRDALVANRKSNRNDMKEIEA